MRDHRRSFRIQMVLPIRYTRLTEKETQLVGAGKGGLLQRLGDEHDGLTSQGETLDIGGNGLCFLTSETLAVGTLLRIRLKLSSTTLSVELVAKVLRVEPRTNGSGEGSKFAIAVRFVEIGDVQREQIIKFIFDQERQALRRRKAKFAS